MPMIGGALQAISVMGCELLATFIFVAVILAATNPTIDLPVARLVIRLTLFATGLSVTLEASARHCSWASRAP
jgi:glycerol uptake facilitator-like aquaporin